MLESNAHKLDVSVSSNFPADGPLRCTSIRCTCGAQCSWDDATTPASLISMITNLHPSWWPGEAFILPAEPTETIVIRKDQRGTWSVV